MDEFLRNFWSSMGLFLSAGCAAAASGMIVMYLSNLAAAAKEQKTNDKDFVLAMRSIALRRLGPYTRFFLKPGALEKIQAKITEAGDPGELRAEEFAAFQLLSALVFGPFGMLMLGVLDVSLLFSPLFFVFGFFFPHIWLRDQILSRKLNIARALPYSIDLLTLSVEAGLDFTGAVGKVVEKGREGPLRDEFRLMLNQLRLGKTREEALKIMAERVQLQPLTNFIQALIQADRMGTSLGKVLRIQSTQMRVDRTQRAEKLANEAPVKMLFPLIFCIFPTVFLVLFGPILFQYMTQNN
ncbi:MAG: hypothetical protein GMKNLPBB_00190 [Myxococcota bacterium]|nr:hypothetical protein [Myxococcota bacterium]